MYELMRSIKSVVPVGVKARIKYLLSHSSDRQLDCYRGKQKVIVALAADYGNLGDIAITFAQEAFLRTCYPDFEIVDFPISATFTRLKALKRIVSPNDIVTIVGGGNMGDLHYTIEDCRRFVIEAFPRNRIISFPQTIDFSKSEFGRRQLQKTIQVYRKHDNLHLFARESISFDLMKKAFPGLNVYLAPDIVLSMNQYQKGQMRDGIMLCIRNDDESAFTGESLSTFMRTISSAFTNCISVDTHIGRDRLSIQDREAELFNIWKSFRKAQVVITDRLHGMIFAAITGTPCVVLQNNNHKIKSTYESWLRPLNHIRLQENFDAEETLQTVSELSRYQKIEKQQPDLAEHFKLLKRVVIGQ